VPTDSTHGTVTLADGIITYTPAPDYNGAASFDYIVEDNGTTKGVADPLTATGRVLVTVTAVNDPPVANDDRATTTPKTAVRIAVLANDTDVDGDTLSVESATTPAHGSVTVNADSTISYTPAEAFSGIDRFDYTVADGQGGRATGHVTVSVAGNLAIVADNTGAAVSVIDLTTNSVTATLRVGAGPIGATVTSDSRLGLVSEFSGAGIVRVLDLSATPPTAVGAITVPAIPFPESTAVTPDGRFAVVSDGGGETDVVSVDLQTGSVISTVPQMPSNEGGAITPDGRLVLLLSSSQNVVAVLSLSDTGALTDTGQRVALAGQTLGARTIAISPDGRIALVTNAAQNLVSVLKITGGAVSLVTSIGNLGSGTSGVSFTPDGRKAYVSNFSSSDIAVLNVSAADAVTDTGVRIAVPGGTPNTFFGVPGIAVTPDGTRLYVVGRGVVSIVNTATDTVSPTTITVGGSPAGIGMPEPR